MVAPLFHSVYPNDDFSMIFLLLFYQSDPMSTVTKNDGKNIKNGPEKRGKMKEPPHVLWPAR